MSQGTGQKPREAQGPAHQIKRVFARAWHSEKKQPPDNKLAQLDHSELGALWGTHSFTECSPRAPRLKGTVSSSHGNPTGNPSDRTIAAATIRTTVCHGHPTHSWKALSPRETPSTLILQRRAASPCPPTCSGAVGPGHGQSAPAPPSSVPPTPKPLHCPQRTR